jgi:hypothetical protein
LVANEALSRNRELIAGNERRTLADL